MERALKGKELMMTNHREPPKRCPRCESTNTKFCYYNNYSQSQPRHFCKACRRYWTEGGTLRNVPQGGGSYRRGNKRPRRPSSVDMTSGSVLYTGTEVIVPMPPSPPSPLYFDGGTGRRATVDMTSGSVVSTGPEVMPPMPPPFFFGGGIGGDQGVMTAVFQPFHPGCAAMMTDFDGFPMLDQGPFNPQPMLPPFLNLPIHPQQSPPFDPNLMIPQPRVAISSHQQMSITVFTSTTTGPSVSAAGSGNGEGYWTEFNNGGAGGGGPPPPTP